MDRLSQKRQKQAQRKRRVRKNISGTADRPRLSVFRSNRNIAVQAIDDVNGKTLASASSMEKELKLSRISMEGGTVIGRKIAERLRAANVETVVFDRNGYQYHGIVKALADSAREAGLNF